MTGTPSAAQTGRRFGLTIGPALLVLAALALWRGRPTGSASFAVVAALLVLCALAQPALLAPVERTWMKMAHLISRVTTPVFMGVMYYVLFTPVGALRRVAGRNPLARPRGASSFWVSRPESQRRSDLKRQF